MVEKLNRLVHVGWSLVAGPVVWIAAAVLIATAWTTHLDNGRVRRDLSQLLAAREYPYLTSGRYMDIAKFATQTDSYGEAPGDYKGRRLIIVSSDLCGICEKNVVNWKRLLTDMPIGKEPLSVWLVTFNQGKLFNDLKQVLVDRKVPHRVFQINDSRDFSLRTGIVGIPLTMVIDKDNQMEAVHSGLLQEGTSLRLRQVLDGGITEAKNRPFLRLGEQESVKHSSAK